MKGSASALGVLSVGADMVGEVGRVYIDCRRQQEQQNALARDLCSTKNPGNISKQVGLVRQWGNNQSVRDFEC
jgi:hypothetical protein